MSCFSFISRCATGLSKQVVAPSSWKWKCCSTVIFSCRRSVLIVTTTSLWRWNPWQMKPKPWFCKSITLFTRRFVGVICRSAAHVQIIRRCSIWPLAGGRSRRSQLLICPYANRLLMKRARVRRPPSHRVARPVDFVTALRPITGPWAGGTHRQAVGLLYDDPSLTQ